MGGAIGWAIGDRSPILDQVADRASRVIDYLREFGRRRKVLVKECGVLSQQSTNIPHRGADRHAEHHRPKDIDVGTKSPDCGTSMRAQESDNRSELQSSRDSSAGMAKGAARFTICAARPGPTTDQPLR